MREGDPVDERVAQQRRHIFSPRVGLADEGALGQTDIALGDNRLDSFPRLMGGLDLLFEPAEKEVLQRERPG